MTYIELAKNRVRWRAALLRFPQKRSASWGRYMFANPPTLHLALIPLLLGLAAGDVQIGVEWCVSGLRPISC